MVTVWESICPRAHCRIGSSLSKGENLLGRFNAVEARHLGILDKEEEGVMVEEAGDKNEYAKHGKNWTKYPLHSLLCFHPSHPPLILRLLDFDRHLDLDVHKNESIGTAGRCFNSLDAVRDYIKVDVRMEAHSL